MENFVIITDSACDINPSVLKEWEVEVLNLKFHFEGEDKEYSNDEMEIDTFYQRMKAGETAKTSAINPQEFENFFEPFFAKGLDILYLGFSSGLSTTYNSSRIAAAELQDKYPERKIICLDTLCASAGQGLLVYLAAEKKKSGATMVETATYTEDLIPSLCHWFTVDDLVYLKRGGRVSSAAAIIGSVLGIKPVLHVDDEGKLIPVTKVRGRRAALSALVEKYGELAKTKGEGTVYISMADCVTDAENVKNQLKEKFGADVQIITDIGPVIGAHSGPGTIALFFIGKER